MTKKAVVFLGLIIAVAAVVGCGPRETVISNLGNAENSLFTRDGRLFITGSKIWEIEEGDDGYEAQNLTENMECLFTGIVEYREHLFAVCSEDEEGEAWLIRAALDDAPSFEKIYPLSGFTIANGMVVDKAGHLYIADETMTNTKGKIVRLTLDSDTVPDVIPESDTVWLSGEAGAQSPNGMTILDDTLFFTNFDISTLCNIKTSIKRVAIEGDHPGAVETVFERNAFTHSSFFDDMTSTYFSGGHYLVVADYLRGSVLVVDAFDTLQPTPFYETDPDKFAGPTSCVTGPGLGFGLRDILVTEGGIVGVDPNSNFGNRLSVVSY